jgi:hypothetical protein
MAPSFILLCLLFAVVCVGRGVWSRYPQGNWRRTLDEGSIDNTDFVLAGVIILCLVTTVAMVGNKMDQGDGDLSRYVMPGAANGTTGMAIGIRSNSSNSSNSSGSSGSGGSGGGSSGSSSSGFGNSSGIPKSSEIEAAGILLVGGFAGYTWVQAFVPCWAVAATLITRSMQLLVVHEVSGDGDENKFLFSTMLAAIAGWVCLPTAIFLPLRLDGVLALTAEQISVFFWCGPAIVPLLGFLSVIVGVLIAAIWKASISHRIRAATDWWKEMRQMRDIHIGIMGGAWVKMGLRGEQLAYRSVVKDSADDGLYDNYDEAYDSDDDSNRDPQQGTWQGEAGEAGEAEVEERSAAGEAAGGASAVSAGSADSLTGSLTGSLGSPHSSAQLKRGSLGRKRREQVYVSQAGARETSGVVCHRLLLQNNADEVVTVSG